MSFTVTNMDLRCVSTGIAEMDGDKAVPGAGGSFTFYELGEPLFDEDGNLNAAIPPEKIREYVWYMETKLPLQKSASKNETQNADALLPKNGKAGKTQNVIAGANQNVIAGAGQNDNGSFLGVCNRTAYYFHYDSEQGTTLDDAFLASIQTKAESYVIYADACAVSEAFLTKHHITFKKIPRDIERL